MSDFRFGVDDYGLDYYPHDVCNEDGLIDWDKVESVEIDWVTFVRKREDSPSATDSVRALVERYEKRIAELEQKVDDLQGMLGNLPPEGKCAILVVHHKDGEYVWQSEPFDFASYVAVDLEADTYTGKPFCDPFGKADHADELTMAGTLREAAARLDEQGDFLGVIGLQGERIEKLEQLVRDWAAAPCAECDPWDEHFACDHFDGHDCMLGVRMTELGLVD